MGLMTYAEAAEHVPREAGRAMPVEEIWAAIAARGLVETQGEPPEATLGGELDRRSANSGISEKRGGAPRFYRRSDGAYGLWANLTPEQQRAVTKGALSDGKSLDVERGNPEFARRVFESLATKGSRSVVASLFAQLIQNAHAIHPACWKLTVRPTDWRLVVGLVQIVKLTRRGLSVLSVPDSALAPEDHALLRQYSTIDVTRPRPRGRGGSDPEPAPIPDAKSNEG